MKKWTVATKQIDFVAKIDVCPGICITALQIDDEATDTLYVGATDGVLRKINF